VKEQDLQQQIEFQQMIAILALCIDNQKIQTTIKVRPKKDQRDQENNTT
jgi:hypothetical protein